MGKRKLSSWNLFVMKVKKENPDKQFKDVLKLASTLKKKGSNYANFVKTKTEKVVKKIGKFSKSFKKGKKGKKSQKRKSKKN